ncbi:MAG TPA: hypothetical protein PLW93_01680 [Candidatus Absconditabacterales bacterium]|nr:hypothetical protein [Candidatus Absconditabacterales bacterium]HNG96961.1 hypothetical protein [Candidatus Absconditabacterales bacterium]
MIRLLIIVIYLVTILLLGRGANKIAKDSQSVMGSLYESINHYFLTINTTIGTINQNTDPKWKDLLEVVYAKKKRFLNQKDHRIATWYELFVALKDDIQYMNAYLGDSTTSLYDTGLDNQTQGYFSFLFRIKPRQTIIRGLFTILTLGIGPGFIRQATNL